MRLRTSQFVHSLDVGPNNFLILHAVSQSTLKVDGELDRLIRFFRSWRTLPDCLDELGKLVPYDVNALLACISSLCERKILTDRTFDDEVARASAQFGATHGRDPGQLLEKYRRELKEGGRTYWAAGSPQGFSELGRLKKRVDVILLGDCDMHMETDFMRKEADRRGIDLRVAATSADDFAFASEHKHDAVFIGALHARHFIVEDVADGIEPFALFLEQAKHALTQLRRHTKAPLLIDNLPEPTVEPLGLAEHGVHGHRNRFRSANLALADLVEQFDDVWITDVAATLGLSGSVSLIDDHQVGFTHMGSPGWMLQRPESEKIAVHNLLPDMAPLADQMNGDPYLRESVISAAHIDVLQTVLGWDRKKCVIVDLDNTLWPGVLAETGAPFGWTPSVSGVFSYVGLYFGLHEALLCLKKRGIVLACVSKNDESVVRELWRYGEGYPVKRLLTLDDFVSYRINWEDKATNIRSIADELGFALTSFLFIDDHPVERDRVRTFLPDIEVWGDNPFDLRRRLLQDPRLQVARVTVESGDRTQLVKAQLDRQKLRLATSDENSYLASLNVEVRVERLSEPDRLDRIEELFQRTTQFNTTGQSFSVSELQSFIGSANRAVFRVFVKDRFGDQGLVGAAVIDGREITGLVLSCRVLSLGVEHQFLKTILETITVRPLRGRIVPTARNIPVRNLYRDHGFEASEDGLWQIRQ